MSTSSVSTAADRDAPAAHELADAAVTPGLLLQAAAEARRRADQAERDLLAVAVEWAHAHPDTPSDADHSPRASWRASTNGGGPEGDGSPDPAEPGADEETLAWFGLPAVRWDAPAGFAAAVGLSTTAGRTLLRDALVLRHRMPRLQARLDAGDLAVWRARRIASRMIGHPADVVTHLDQVLAPVAHAIGAVAIDHRIDAAMLLLHAEERELAQLAELDARHATLHPETIGHTGIAEMTLRGDWADLDAFDTTLNQVAHAMAATEEPGSPESYDTHAVRRTRALAVLADPATALALLDGAAGTEDAGTGRPKREIYARVHLTTENLYGLDPITYDTNGRAILDAAVRAWCGRTDTHLTILPVLDTAQVLATHPHHTGYTIPDPMRRVVETLEPTCVFPWCTRPAHRCDSDHTTAYCHHDPPHGGQHDDNSHRCRGGPTCPCNLAPLCRHHHQLKTHADWTYSTPEPGVHHWTDPHGRHYLRDHHTTTDLT